MLSVIRKYVQSWFVRLILILIIVGFVFFGVENFKPNKVSDLVIVNGASVDFVEYRLEYNNLVDRYKNFFNNSLNSILIENSDFEKMTLNRIINKKLLLQQASSIGVCVTDVELISMVRQQIPNCSNNGVFSVECYHKCLNESKIPFEQFENVQMEVLLLKKMINEVLKNVEVLHDQINDCYNWKKSLVSIGYIMFSFDNYDLINYNENEFNCYFDLYKENYKNVSMRKVRYIVFDPSNYRGIENTSNEDVINFFDLNVGGFVTDKIIYVNQIFIKIENNIDFNIQERAKNRALEIINMVKNGKDFSMLSKFYSYIIRNVSDNNSQDVEYGDFVKLFGEGLFSVFREQMYFFIKTNFGVHVINVNDVVKIRNVSFCEVKNQIFDKLIRENAHNVAYDNAVVFLENCFNSSDLIKNSYDCGFDVLKTGWISDVCLEDNFFNQDIYLRNIIFNMKIGQISDVYEVDGLYYIVQVFDEVKSEVCDFDDVRGAVIIDFQYEKRKLMVHRDAVSVVNDVKKSTNDINDIELNKTDFVEREQLFSYDSLDFAQKRFFLVVSDFLNKNKFFIEPIITAIGDGKGYYVAYIETKNYSKNKLLNLDKYWSRIKTELLDSKSSYVFDTYIDNLRNNSEIIFINDKIIAN